MTKKISDKECAQELYEKLVEGNTQVSLQIYENYIKSFAVADFVDNILKPTLSKIEDNFDTEKISITEEYVAKNVAATLVKIITDKKN